MLDHVGLIVRSVSTSQAFYSAALKPLGYELVVSGDATVAFGPPDQPLLWLSEAGEHESPTSPIHLALIARDRPSVDAFYRAALEAGGRDNGPPGLRPEYHPNYYGAFVFDPDGHNLEAVSHAPPR